MLNIVNKKMLNLKLIIDSQQLVINLADYKFKIL